MVPVGTIQLSINDIALLTRQYHLFMNRVLMRQQMTLTVLHFGYKTEMIALNRLRYNCFSILRNLPYLRGQMENILSFNMLLLLYRIETYCAWFHTNLLFLLFLLFYSRTVAVCIVRRNKSNLLKSTYVDCVIICYNFYLVIYSIYQLIVVRSFLYQRSHSILRLQSVWLAAVNPWC